MARDGGRCRLCGAPAVEVDHVVRLADGGSDGMVNKRALCVACHRRVSRTGARAGMGGGGVKTSGRQTPTAPQSADLARVQNEDLNWPDSDRKTPTS